MIPKNKYLQALTLGAIMSAGLIAVNTLAPRIAMAQTSQGTLTGVVRDSSGAVIVGATVSAKNVGTGDIRTTKTSSLGAYRLDAVPPGQYVIHVEATGFEQFEAKNVTVQPSLLVSYDLVLKLGHVEQTVSVTESEVLLDKENGSLSSTISGEEMAKLPIFTLNPVEVLTTVPGVQLVANSGFSNGDNIQVSGARPRANNFMIDGEEVNDATLGGQAVQPDIPDMYSDIVVYTHNPPAEFGRASGGVVNLITKGGTNTLHGSGWELYSGSGLNSVDAQTRQLPKDRGNKARSDEHQYGFTAGGPIIRNKLFAFGAAQWSRTYGMEQASELDLPNAAGVAVLKSLAAGSGTTATNAALLLQYLSNATYLDNFSDFGSVTTVGLGAACPTGNVACAAGLGIDLYRRPSVAEQSPDTQWTYRIDYTPTAKDTFTARYLHDRSSLTPDFFTNGAALPGFDTYQGGPSELGQGTWTHIFSPHFLNEFRVAETRLHFYFAPTAETLANPAYADPNLNFTDLSSLGFDQNFPQGRGQDMYQFQDTITWTHGRQSLRIGADIGRRLEKDLVSQNAKGALNFAAKGSGDSSEGNFLLNQLGPSGSATKTYGPTRMDPHSWRSGIFAQDDIKMSPDLTVNLGVRYDYYTNPENVLAYPGIDPNDPNAPINSVFKVATDAKNIAPRIGFAYTPHADNRLSDGKTVVRGGFGIFYDSDFTNIALNEAQNSPNAVAGTLTATKTAAPNGLPNATSLIGSIPDVLNGQSTVLSVVKNLTSPYTVEWNLGVERELPWQIGLSATYVGSRGVKLYANQQYNYFSIDTGERLDPTRGAINARGNFGDSDYNGIEVGVKRNFSRGLAITGAYVYSKALDDVSEVFTVDSNTTSYGSDLTPGGKGHDWGNSTYDHRQYLAITYVWTPIGLHSNAKGIDTLLSAATRHWTVSGASRFQTGAYATVNLTGLDANGDGNNANDRPVLSNKSAAFSSVGIDGGYLCGDPACDESATPGVYYDLAANNASGALTVVTPSSVHWLVAPYGPTNFAKTIGRDSYLTPGSLFNDIALEKDVPTSLLHLDRGQFVLRAEVENLANHNNVNLPWGGISNNLNLLNVGYSEFLNYSQARDSSDAAANRNIRFWLKYTF
jgi:outer membrane receptor protein involved in Fe transport